MFKAKLQFLKLAISKVIHLALVINIPHVIIHHSTCYHSSSGTNFIFHSNLSINPNKTKEFPKYYQNIFIKWKEHFLPLLPLHSSVASQCLWHNKYIKIDYKTIFSSSISAKGINFVGQLFQNNQQIKKWDKLKAEFDLIENQKILIVQIAHALFNSWKEILQNYTESINTIGILLSRIIIWLQNNKNFPWIN